MPRMDAPKRFPVRWLNRGLSRRGKTNPFKNPHSCRGQKITAKNTAVIVTKIRRRSASTNDP